VRELEARSSSANVECMWTQNYHPPTSLSETTQKIGVASGVW